VDTAGNVPAPAAHANGAAKTDDGAGDAESA
jgi:hypothetical protein